MGSESSECVRVPFSSTGFLVSSQRGYLSTKKKKTVDLGAVELKGGISALNQTLFGVVREVVNYNESPASTWSSAHLIQD